MKLKFKKQEFQEEAVKSVVDVFEGQQKGLYKYTFRKDKGVLDSIFAYKNEDISLQDNLILQNINNVQKRNNLKLSPKLEGEGKNLTIEMETGTGKTYAYINTIYELNKIYGWCKFVIVVPSVAIREGVSKSFEIMEEHFASMYSKKIRHFIFDSQKTNQLESFATNNGINVMIINSQSFNSKEKNNMFKKTEYGRRLIDLIAGTNPIIIIDEPQSVEGVKTKLGLMDFNSLFTLRYSATHREDYNMLYTLDAVDAFNKKIVKKISVKGINIKGTTATHGYLYLEGIDISKRNPKARIEIEVKQKKEVKRQSFRLDEGDDLYIRSGKLEQYKGYKVSQIKANTNSVTFTNGKIIYLGDVNGEINEEHKRRIQIRETIKSHLNKERILFEKGIKALSLFFIDEVANYRLYDEEGNQEDGIYAKIFVEEYNSIIEQEKGDYPPEYKKYLESISPTDTHKGYFSIDKKNRLINPKETGRGGNKTCNDVSAYDLIMKEKEKLLDLKEPTRFIFSHSALKEGWDNPNVFQICVLRNTDSKVIKKRQEIGRGLRLCVNQEGVRIDEDYEGFDFSQANLLTVVANESYEEFAGGLQKEFSEELRERPSKLTIEFLIKKKINGQRISESVAQKIVYDFTQKGYINEEGLLTDKYHKDRMDNTLEVREELKEELPAIIDVVKELYETNVQVDNANDIKPLTNKLNNNFDKPEFKKLWKHINSKTTYQVKFDTKSLIENSVNIINEKLNVLKISAEITEGTSKDYVRGEDIKEGKLFGDKKTKLETLDNTISNTIKYDLIGKIVDDTDLTRETIIGILQKISLNKFNQYKSNPEDFIIRISNLINDEKAEIILKNIIYIKSDENISINVFEKSKFFNAKYTKLKKYIYDYLIYDSEVEYKFAKKLDEFVDVLVFSKLPKGEYTIYTPVGKFSPDWAIVFEKNKIKYAYFVIETKGSVRKMDLRGVENVKIECAKKHFEVISDGKVKFDAVSSFDELENELELIA
jgi:type III restriction enzyme